MNKRKVETILRDTLYEECYNHLSIKSLKMTEDDASRGLEGWLSKLCISE